MNTPNKIYLISPEFLHKNWKVGHTIEGCSDRTQFEIIDVDTNGDVLLRKLPADERVKPDYLIGRLNIDPKPAA